MQRKIETEEEKLKIEKERLRGKAKQEVKNIKKKIAIEKVEGQAEVEKKTIKEEKLKSAVPLTLGEKLKQEGDLKEKAKQEAVNTGKRVTPEVAAGDVEIRKERENIAN